MEVFEDVFKKNGKIALKNRLDEINPEFSLDRFNLAEDKYVQNNMVLKSIQDNQSLLDPLPEKTNYIADIDDLSGGFERDARRYSSSFETNGEVII